MSKAREIRLEEALRECIDVLVLAVEPLPREDPDFGHLVRELGDRIGYGAMMSSASAAWRAKLHPAQRGGEHAHGACVSTIQHTLRKARSALRRDPKRRKK